jgi:hypothetical protein
MSRRPRTGYEGPKAEYMYSSTPSLTSALDVCAFVCVYVVNAAPRSLYPREKDPVPIVQETGSAPGPVWTGAENITPTGIRSPKHPVRSKSLYRLHFPGLLHHTKL